MVFEVTNRGPVHPSSETLQREDKVRPEEKPPEDREGLLVRFKAQSSLLHKLEHREQLDAEGQALAQSIDDAIAFLEGVAEGVA